MGSYRSKEDDVAKISTSVYVTNFPESVYVKELFNSCKVYGHVVDSFIPNTRPKNGKRFRFIRFLNVFNAERLVSNLCTVWIGRHKLQANIARFHRSMASGHYAGVKSTGGIKVNKMKTNSSDNVNEKDNRPIESLMGRVKEFASLANLKMKLNNEGFMDVKIQYMGEFWVMLEFVSKETMKKFQDNVSTGSWFSVIKAASMEFQPVKQIAWVEVEGIPFKLWSGKTFIRIENKWGELLDVDDQEDTCFYSKRLCIHTKMDRTISEEFKIIHQGKTYWVRATETPGKGMENSIEKNVTSKNCKFTKQTNDGGNDLISSGHFKVSEIPRNGGSILGLLDEVVKVGQVMGYKMEGCVSNIAEIIEAQGAKEVRCKSDRFGSVFNEQGALSFNSFIENSGLMEINLGRCHFTWCHKSSNKMSKLDRFLVSKSLLNTCPNIATTTLDRYLSDHRPIILREVYVDYSPIPLKIFHHWFDIEGFNKVVEDAWNDYVGEEANKMSQCKRDLEVIDGIIDSGNGGEDEVYKRAGIINKMQKINEIQSKDLAQKVKIKWAIEGDENSSFFHGMLNKKRTSMSVWGVMVDGVWVDDPHKVKKEFLDHFSASLCKPNKKGASILMDFLNKIYAAQLRDFECEVSDEEIKRAVWNCRTKKAPGPGGFTFGFFRRFWNPRGGIEMDQFGKVVDLIKEVSLNLTADRWL
nr:nucleotide-binding alpha-beta plait domain-containing protein [Tanacetum cinerariifolium]